MLLWKIWMYLFLIAASASLVLGLAGTGSIWLAWAAVLPVVGLWLSRRLSVGWLASISLLAYVGLAVAGILLGAAPAWMVVSSAAALAGWDLVHMERSLGSSSQPRLVKKHFEILFIAVIVGLTLALVGSQINLTLPFIVMLVLIFLGLFSLDRLSRYLSQRATRKS